MWAPVPESRSGWLSGNCGVAPTSSDFLLSDCRGATSLLSAMPTRPLDCCLVHIVRAVRAITGLGLMRDVPFFTINLVLYERLRLLVRGQLSSSAGEQRELSTIEATATGAVAQVG
jgi:hypothetical protein